VQKLSSLAIPRAKIEYDLVAALEKESETLQNITDCFVPLMKYFNMYFFWEQEQTSLGYRNDYIVTMESAAPPEIMADRSGIAANHIEMVRFEENTCQGFRSVACALQRYCEEAPDAVKQRYEDAKRRHDEERTREAADKLARIQPLSLDRSMISRALNGERRVPSYSKLEAVTSYNY
jgi:protein SERAC1